MADRHDVSPADEQMRLAKRNLAIGQLGCSRDDEQRASILFELGILMRLAGILDGERMKIELCLDPLEKLVFGLE